MHYGLTDDEWNSALDQMRQALTGVARAGHLIIYGELSRSIGCVQVRPHHGGAPSSLLAVLQDQDHEAWVPTLSALVAKQDIRQPSTGHYDKARRLGHTVRQAHTCYQRAGA